MDQAERSKAFTPLARGRGPDGTRIDNSSFLNRGPLELDFGNPALKDHCYVLVRAVDAVQDHAVNDCGARQALHVLGQLLQAHVVLIRTVLQIVHDRCETGHVVRLAPRRAISAPNCCSTFAHVSIAELYCAAEVDEHNQLGGGGEHEVRRLDVVVAQANSAKCGDGCDGA